MAEYYLHRFMRPLRRAYYHLDYFLFRLMKGFHTSHIYTTALRKILVVELTMIGDIIVATPALDAIKKICPKAQLHVLMYKRFSSVLENNSSIDHILGVEEYPSLVRFEQWRFLLHRIASEKYDAVVILHHGTFALSLLMLLAKIPLRIGCVLSGLLVGKGFFLTHKPAPYADNAHVVEQNLGVVHLLGDALSGPVRMSFSEKDEKVAEGFLKKCKIRSDRPLIALHTGTRHDSHQWYENRFAQVADTLIERSDYFHRR